MSRENHFPQRSWDAKVGPKEGSWETIRSHHLRLVSQNPALVVPGARGQQGWLCGELLTHAAGWHMGFAQPWKWSSMCCPVTYGFLLPPCLYAQKPVGWLSLELADHASSRSGRWRTLGWSMAAYVCKEERGTLGLPGVCQDVGTPAKSMGACLLASRVCAGWTLGQGENWPDPVSSSQGGRESQTRGTGGILAQAEPSSPALPSPGLTTLFLCSCILSEQARPTAFP